VALLAFADVVAAKTPAEIKSIARSTTVEIKLQKNGSVGSGVIVHQQGDLYTLVTNRHVVCGAAGNGCAKLPASESYSLGLVDGQRYPVERKTIRFLGDDLDLAIIQFRSSRKYTVVKLAEPGSLKSEDVLYTAGFPYARPGFYFDEGKAIAVVNKRLIGDAGGYTVIYNADTLPGMSGGGVFNGNGQMVAIHGYGDRYQPGTELEDSAKLNTKIGYNRGIPVRWLLQSLSETGINIGNSRSTTHIRAGRQELPKTADEYFIAGFNKFVVPGGNILIGKRQSIQEFTTAIKIDPQYSAAYFMRGYVYVQLQDQ
jgi:S1-C subfamily serine protease